jgi:protein-S-isoprenylcysteine O-methyltransferase Ste14
VRAVDWIFLAGSFAELTLLASLVVSIVAPRRRLWPPPAGSARAFAWMWGWTLVASGAGLVLAIADYGAWILDDQLWIVAGSVTLALGAGLADWGIRTLGRMTSSGRGGVFSEAGPYRWSRNPQYMGDVLMTLGVVLIADSWRVAALGCGGIACLLLAPLAEERWLVERYGDAFLAYRRRVPRLVGPRRT